MIEEELRALIGRGAHQRTEFKARVLVERGYIEEVGLGTRRMREEMTSLGLPEPQFREDGFSFAITFRSIAPREGVIVVPDPFRALLERGEINDRQYHGLLDAREHGTIARREYAALTGVSERTATSRRLRWRLARVFRPCLLTAAPAGCGDPLRRTHGKARLAYVPRSRTQGRCELTALASR